MSWEIRRGRRYYYRSERRNGVSKNVYYGNGEMGRQAARDDRRRRERRRDLLQQLNHLHGLMKAYGGNVDVLLAADLILAGWSRRNRDWKEPQWKQQRSS